MKFSQHGMWKKFQIWEATNTKVNKICMKGMNAKEVESCGEILNFFYNLIFCAVCEETFKK